MGNFWRIVNHVIDDASVIIIVADARMPEESINHEILRKIEKAGKKYVIAFNKCDLLTPEGAEILNKSLQKYDHTIKISAKDHKNTMVLLRKINEIVRGEEAVVGIVGYPNTGKSSLINAIKGSGAAPVSSRAGFTKALQKVRVTAKIFLLDTPGVIPEENKDNVQLQTMIASRNPDQLKDPEQNAILLITDLKGKVEEHYGINTASFDNDDYLDLVLEAIAIKMNFKKKGNINDIRKAAVQVLDDWQRGKIKT
jgi:ribosome biogenesis GTPase A